jgi:hypothetical protein
MLQYTGFLALLQAHNRCFRSKVAKDLARLDGRPNVDNRVSMEPDSTIPQRFAMPIGLALFDIDSVIGSNCPIVPQM